MATRSSIKTPIATPAASRTEAADAGSIGAQKPAGRTPSIREVALKAQVGLGTVSRVINGGESVNERTRKRVLAAIAELGYVPDLVAQSMRNRRTMSFACVLRDFTVPVLSMFVDAMQQEIDASGYSLIVASSYHDPQRELALLQRLAQRRIDGLVIATSSESNPELSNALRALKMPVVLLDREQPLELDAVLVDHGRGTRLAIQHLIQLGHRRIGFISGEPGLHPTSSRLAAYESTLRVAGLEVAPELVRLGSFGADAGSQQARSLLALKNPPTALLAGGTAFLPGVIQAARERGLRIPHDLSVVSGAESNVAKLVEPSFAMVRWDHDRLGQAAGRMLKERLASPEREPQRLVFVSELVLGGSCAAPPKKAKAA